jgi:hypothetical protein
MCAAKRLDASQESLVWALSGDYRGVGTHRADGGDEASGHFNEGLIIAFSLFVFSHFWSRQCAHLAVVAFKPSRQGTVNKRPEELTTNELGESNMRVLPEPTFSVTDHTTNILETAARKRESE